MEKRSIFADLEIDQTKLGTDYKQFAKDCYAAADNLASVLESKNSISDAKRAAEIKASSNKEAKVEARNLIRDIFLKVNEEAETLDMDVLYYLVQEAKELAKDLDLTFHSRARDEMIANSPNAVDKKLAHDQYMRLRSAFETVREYIKLFHGETMAPIAAKTGNYGSDRVKYPAYRLDGQVYNNYRAVARILGWNPDEFKSHQDFRDRLVLEENDTVEVIEVTL